MTTEIKTWIDENNEKAVSILCGMLDHEEMAAKLLDLMQRGELEAMQRVFSDRVQDRADRLADAMRPFDAFQNALRQFVEA